LFPYSIGLGRGVGRCPEQRLQCFKGANIWSGQCRVFPVAVVRLLLLLSSESHERTVCPARSGSFLALERSDTWFAVSSVCRSIELRTNSCPHLSIFIVFKTLSFCARHARTRSPARKMPSVVCSPQPSRVSLAIESSSPN
jgi:hypothetical protein